MIEVVVNEGAVAFTPITEKQESESITYSKWHYIDSVSLSPQHIPHPEYPGVIYNKLILI